MTTRFTTENLKSLFTYPFKERDWQGKLAILGALFMTSFLIVPAFFVYGYIYEVMRRIIVEKQAPSLPEWDDWSRYFNNGLKMFGVMIIYSIPGMLFSFGGSLPMVALSLWVINNPDLAFIASVSTPIFMLLMTLGTLLSVVIAPFEYAAITHMVARDEFSAAFRVKEWWPVFRSNVSGFLLTYLVMMVIMTAISLVSQAMAMTIVLICILPVIFGAGYGYTFLISTVLFAQTYNDGVEMADEIEPVQAPA